MICINALSAYERKFCVFMTILMLIHVFWFHRLAVHQKFNHYFYPKLCREEDINSIHPTISFIVSCLYKNMSRQNLVLPCQNNPTKKDTCLTGFMNMCTLTFFATLITLATVLVDIETVSLLCPPLSLSMMPLY